MIKIPKKNKKQAGFTRTHTFLMWRNHTRRASKKYVSGFTYIELIVVLSIFAVMSAIIIFNYGEFQAKVDIKNLASDIALKIVEAQKSSLSGDLSTQSFTAQPSYGVYFDLSTPTTQKQFIYFADLNDDRIYDEAALNTISITKGNYISRIDSYSGGVATSVINPLVISFKRPDSSAIFSYSNGVPLTGFDYIQVTIASTKAATSAINIYPSGRVEIGSSASSQGGGNNNGR